MVGRFVVPATLHHCVVTTIGAAAVSGWSANNATNPSLVFSSRAGTSIHHCQANSLTERKVSDLPYGCKEIKVRDRAGILLRHVQEERPAELCERHNAVHRCSWVARTSRPTYSRACHRFLSFSCRSTCRVGVRCVRFPSWTHCEYMTLSPEWVPFP